MISDILFDAAKRIRTEYLDAATMAKVYQGEMRQKVISAVEHMDEVRRLLDRAPEGDGIPSIERIRMLGNGTRK